MGRGSSVVAAACGTAVLVGGWLGGSALARAQPSPDETLVGIASGPTTEATFNSECSDVASGYDESTSFVVSRAGSTTDPLTVRYSVEGGRPGVDFVALPGEVVLGAGMAASTVAVDVVDTGERSRLVSLTLSLRDGAGYVVAPPRAITITFESRRDPALGPLDCNPDFQLLDVAQNTMQTIPLGAVPAPLAFTGATSAIAQVVGGSLPSGVAIAEMDGGLTTRFSGAASAVGTYAATLRVCPAAIVFTCRETVLTVTVLADAVLPVTGGSGTGPLSIAPFLVVAALAAGAAGRAGAARQARP